MRRSQSSTTADFKLQAQVQKGDNQKVISMIENSGLSVNHFGKYTSSLLIDSIKSRNYHLADALIARGADVGLVVRGESPVGASLLNDDIEMFKRLTELGADVNKYCYGLRGYPIVWAIERGDLSLCKYVLDHGGDPNCYITLIGEPTGVISEVGRTVLMIAAELNHPDIVELLLQSGADPTTTGIEGKTPYQLIERKKGREAVLALLKSYMERSSSVGVAGGAGGSVVAQPTAADFGSFESLVSVLERITKAAAVREGKGGELRWLKLGVEVAHRISGRSPSRGPAAMAEDLQRCVDFLQQGAARLDVWIFLRLRVSEGPQLCLMNHADQWDVLRHQGTASANYGVTHRALVTFLKRLDARSPFRIHECDTGVVGGTLVKRPEAGVARELANQLAEFCPFALEPHDDSVAKLAKALQRTGRFKLWWD